MTPSQLINLDPQLTVADGVMMVDSTDPVLTALERVQAEYVAVAADFARGREELARAREELARADEVREQLSEEVAAAVGERDRLRRQAAHQRERAERLTAALKSVHTSLQSGNLYDLILRACLHITGATRGVYLTVWGASGSGCGRRWTWTGTRRPRRRST